MAKIVLNNSESVHVDRVKHGDYIQVRDSKMRKVGIVQVSKDFGYACFISYPTHSGLTFSSLRGLIECYPGFTFHVEGGENAEG